MRQVGSFSEFLKTGALGPVRPGAVRSLVLQEFGEPEVFSNGWAVLTPQQPMHESSSWGYGFLQVGFKSDVVVDLGFYYAFEGKGLTIPKHLAITVFLATHLHFGNLKTVWRRSGSSFLQKLIGGTTKNANTHSVPAYTFY